MAGHSHWKNIKIKKGAQDAKRGKLFSKLARLIIVAARTGGKDPDTNLRLRYAIDKAKSASMPADTIERAIKKGTGELEGGQLEEVVYEGYGPNGVAVLCEALTDNRNRTAGEVRKVFDVHGGNLGTTGCVAWMFQTRGVVVIDSEVAQEDQLMELTIDAGAEDIQRNGDVYEVSCEPAQFQDVLKSIESAGIEVLSSDIQQVPGNLVDLDAEAGKKVLKLLDSLDDLDDIQSVFANSNIPDSVLEQIES